MLSNIKLDIKKIAAFLFTAANLNKKNVAISLFASVALIQIILAAIGAVNNYSPVPRADTWYEVMRFFTKIEHGKIGLADWFAQHNEHRIVLSRILFWADEKLFHGEVLYLIILNHVFVVLIFGMFYCFIREMSLDKNLATKNHNIANFTKIIAGLLVLTLLFSRVQKENLDWEFQSQFFLAYLLPLLSFYLIYKSHISKSHTTSLFISACFIGFVCIGTMANGVFALPLMAAMSAFLGNRRKAFILAILSVLGFIAYFYNYQKPNEYASIASVVLYYPQKSLLTNITNLVLYVLSYLGGAAHGFGRSTDVTRIIGSFLIIGPIFPALKQIKNPNKSALEIALLTFILYVIATSFAIAGGRSVNGLSQALTSRYTTPTLMAWSALLILYIPNIAALLNKNFTYYLPILLSIVIICLPTQFKVLDSNENQYLKNHFFERKVGSLALELGIKDQLQIDAAEMPGSADFEIETSRTAVENNLSIFNHPLIRDVNSLIGTTESTSPATTCLGNVEEITKIEDSSNYIRIKGWLFDNESKTVPKAIHLLDKDNKIIGYALVGGKHRDKQAILGKNGANIGFKGYLLTSSQNKEIILRGVNPNCEIKITLPPITTIKKIEN